MNSLSRLRKEKVAIEAKIRNLRLSERFRLLLRKVEILKVLEVVEKLENLK